MEEKKKGNTLSDYAIFTGFIMGIFCIAVLPMWIFQEIDKSYAEMMPVVVIAVIPLVSLLIIGSVDKRSRSHTRRLSIGMNLGNGFSIIVIYFAVIARNIELTEYYNNLYLYGAMVSWAAAFILALWESRSRIRETKISKILEEGYPPYLVLGGNVVIAEEGFEAERACYRLTVVNYYNQKADKKTIVVNEENIISSENLKSGALLINEGGKLKVFEKPELTEEYLKSRELNSK